MIVELPAIYIDDVVFDDTDDANWTLLNRYPEPDQTDVPAEPAFVIEIHDLNENGTPQDYTVTIDGVIAYDYGSGFLNGWSGSVSEFQSPGAAEEDIVRIELTPPGPFDSLAEIDVRVQGTINYTIVIDETYSFTIEDLTPPELVIAVATGQRTVLVTFDEPVRALGDGAAADALTPGNYVFDALNDSVTPAVSMVAVSVAAISATEFEVTTDVEMTPLVTYRLTVSNVEDLFGNEI